MRVGQDSAVRRAVLEVEAHAAEEGWDRPPRLYALVPTGELVRAEPAMARSLGIDGESDLDSLTPVVQDDLPAERAFEDTLQQIMWPPGVAGCAAVIERLMLPPDAEADLPDETDGLATYAAEHPDRQDVRIVVGVTRDGEVHCAVRTHRNSEDLLEGPELVPALSRLLMATLAD